MNAREAAQALDAGRCIGKTYQAIEFAKERKATFVAASSHHASLINREEGVNRWDFFRNSKKFNAISINNNILGMSGPFIFDHAALSWLLLHEADRVDKEVDAKVQSKVRKEREEHLKTLNKLNKAESKILAMEWSALGRFIAVDPAVSGSDNTSFVYCRTISCKCGRYQNPEYFFDSTPPKKEELCFKTHHYTSYCHK